MRSSHRWPTAARVIAAARDRFRPGTGFPPDFDDDARLLVERVRHATMTSPERILALRDGLRHIVRREIPGAVVECGVWRGGSMMAAALTLDACDDRRDLYLFDTFEGMTRPGRDDVDLTGTAASDHLRREDPDSSFIWARSGLETVRENMRTTGYPDDLVHYIVGPVEETIPEHAPPQIALLRLDTDWYESTRHELEHLWGRVPPGGIVLIDDYGHWAGARRAVDEFLETLDAAPLLQRIDYTGRLMVKER